MNNPTLCATSGCHDAQNQSTLNQFGSVAFTNLPSSYTPGQSYNIGISITGTTSTRVYGFQLVAMHSDKSQAGTLTPVSNGVSKLEHGGVEHLFHSPAPLTSGSANFTWTAPAAGKGDVIFRIAANAANNNSSPSGDHINTKDVTLSAARNEKLYFAHFGDGQAGSAQVFSQITLVNLSATTAAGATVEIFDDSGNPLSVDLNDEVAAGKKEVTVPAGGSTLLKSDGQGEVQTGSVTVSSDLPLAGVVLFGGTIGVAGVGSSQALQQFVAPMEMNAAAGVSTGIAVMNLGATQQNVEVELRDLAGRVVATGTLSAQPLQPNGHIARFLDEFNWSTAPDLSDFKGTLRATASGGNIAATVIRLSPGEFATLPVAKLQ